MEIHPKTRKAFLTAEWKQLLMVNYQVDKEVLLPFVPAGTELDDFEGAYYISVVGFLFDSTRVRGVAVPFHRCFAEVNLRFYVRYAREGVWRRGVVFISEIVPRRAISFVANRFYGEHYQTLPMKHEVKMNAEQLTVSYQWKVGEKWNFLYAEATSSAEPIVFGSLEEFITEHYWGYTNLGKFCTGVYEVLHPRWKVYNIASFDMFCDAERLYGTAFAGYMSKPHSVLLAEGSDVKVYPGYKIYPYTN